MRLLGAQARVGEAHVPEEPRAPLHDMAGKARQGVGTREEPGFGGRDIDQEIEEERDLYEHLARARAEGGVVVMVVVKGRDSSTGAGQRLQVGG